MKVCLSADREDFILQITSLVTYNLHSLSLYYVNCDAKYCVSHFLFLFHSVYSNSLMVNQNLMAVVVVMSEQKAYLLIFLQALLTFQQIYQQIFIME